MQRGTFFVVNNCLIEYNLYRLSTCVVLYDKISSICTLVAVTLNNKSEPVRYCGKRK